MTAWSSSSSRVSGRQGGKVPDYHNSTISATSPEPFIEYPVWLRQ